jgi:hypothetical protein
VTWAFTLREPDDAFPFEELDHGDRAHRRGQAGRVALRQDFQTRVSRYGRNVSVAAGDGLRVAATQETVRAKRPWPLRWL